MGRGEEKGEGGKRRGVGEEGREGGKEGKGREGSKEGEERRSGRDRIMKGRGGGMRACVSLTSRAYVTGWCGPSW